MIERFLLTNPPFTYYYVFNGIKKDAGFQWMIEHFENRRKLLKEWKLKFSAK